MRKITAKTLAVWLAIVSLILMPIALAALAWQWPGRFDRDTFLAGAFFFSGPVLVLSGLLLVGAMITSRKRPVLFLAGEKVTRPVAGKCDHCQESFTADDVHCPGCGRSLSGRWVRPRMMSANARDREDAETQRVRLELRMRRHPLALAAARSLVELAFKNAPIQPQVETVALVDQCLTDGKLTQSLYRSAARRLHPDQNDGAHLPEWFELQNAVRTLESFHELAEEIRH